ERAQQTPSHSYVRNWEFIGTVDDWAEENGGVAHCTQRSKFVLGDTIEALQPDGTVTPLTPAWIENEEGQRVEGTPHPMMHYTIPCATPLMPYTLLRARGKGTGEGPAEG
ncbi:MAG: U32 family peptidase C-terminal domain-containing protein, partial [Gemmiger sp.]|nr:U32 family peptidase C-terminal domain-containing protein [Gemmiger sp.]